MKALLLGDVRLHVFGDDYPTVDGTCVRDYIHVDDLADAHIAAIDYLDRGGSTTALNLGTGVGTSVKQVLDEIEHVAGREVPHDVVARRAGDPVATYADPTRSRRGARLVAAARHGRHHRDRLPLAPRSAFQRLTFGPPYTHL